MQAYLALLFTLNTDYNMPEKLKVVLCWHMHQPAYYDWHNEEYHLPWTYLHGIKDYIEMAAHLENVPQARAVVNFAPTLLEQIDDYARQIQAFLRDKTQIQDPLLAALNSQPPHAPFLKSVSESNSPVIDARFKLIENCLRANEERMIQRFKPYQALADLAKSLKENPQIVTYLDDQYLIDLLMWYHLAWLGETVRRSDSRVKALIKKEAQFDNNDRQQMLEIIGDLLSGIVPRYKALAENGQVELSVTPFAHPIMPLLLDIFSARESLPDADLSNISCYPDGKERVRWHMREGIKAFEQHFGFKPQGCWPSEGSLSESTIRLMEEFEMRWVATGSQVWNNSMKKSGIDSISLHRPYCLPSGKVRCFFRDDNLSDLIGFEYSKWHGDDAVANFVENLENIARSAHETGAQVTSIIMDGENAWEAYPENAYYFLTALYKKLANHPELELTTFSDSLDAGVTELPNLVAGSWVYGTFSTWIGDTAKNRGWEMLINAKHVFDRISPRLGIEERKAAERQLAICEGSDWCWWFGDYNPSEAVRDFELLYRLHLKHLYRLLGETPPTYLEYSFTKGGGNPATGGTMRKGTEEGA